MEKQNDSVARFTLRIHIDTKITHRIVNFNPCKRLRWEREGTTLEITLNEIENGDWERARLKRGTRTRRMENMQFNNSAKSSNK